MSPDRVLVLTPTGRDAQLVQDSLVAAGFSCQVGADLDSLVAAMKDDAGAMLIAQEALSPEKAEALVAALDAQEPWSDIPVLLLALPASKRLPNARPLVELLGRANVMLLQRPLPLELFLSAVRSAVRARRRQYQMRSLHRELARAVQLGDMFVGILGHDLRTPLGAIKMSAEVIVRGSGDPCSLRSAERIASSADRMARMVEQLLDFARVRQGQGIRLRVVPADLRGIASQVLQEVRDANPRAGLDVSHSGDLSGRWDPDRLGQVFSNLVGNAVQHGVAGYPIGIELDGTEQAVVRVRVGNRGTIAEDAFPTLFEPFKRATLSKAGEKGLGLGLFIAQEIVRAHGGDLTARVEDGMTVFEATLPREASPIETEVSTVG